MLHFLTIGGKFAAENNQVLRYGVWQFVPQICSFAGRFKEYMIKNQGVKTTFGRFSPAPQKSDERQRKILQLIELQDFLMCNRMN